MENRLAILPLRNGKRFGTKRILLFQEEGQSHPIEIGRLDVIACLHECCGCDPERKFGSTKNKCDQCKRVTSWAMSLSRKMLRFSANSLQCRGSSASVSIRCFGQERIKLNTDKQWSDKFLFNKGSIISLEPKLASKKGVEGLDFEVVAMGDDTNKILLQPLAKKKRQSPSPSEELKSSKEATQNINDKFRLYFCGLGQDLSKARTKILSQNVRNLGAEVVDDYKLATHFILANNTIELADVATSLLNISEEELRTHLSSNQVELMLPGWITNSRISSKPQIRDKHYESWSISSSPGKKRKMRKKLSPEEKRRRCIEVNSEFVEVFKRLSELHQSCPLGDFDEWKAYTFRIVAGRIQNLDFEICNDEQVLKRLGKIKGIGTRSIVHLKQYLNNHGRVERILAFEADPKRVAMKNMMNIWGVGRKTALHFLDKEYSSIEDIRNALTRKDLDLERNQLVGVDCYEDFLEEMTRDEVERIGDIITKHVQKLYPGAEVRIMGSYRRGKTSCGDVDCHITHKSFEFEIPNDALGSIVDSLWKSKDLAFHLTFLDGMQTGSQLSDFQKSSKIISEEIWKSQCIKRAISWRYEKSSHASLSYMGVFNSPMKLGRRRRVDLKFYPYRERIFAALYFTGNGFFNRSMRLWARSFGYQLSDHGLFHRDSNERILEANHEREVFEKLELVYKEPTERDCFDAVEPKNAGRTANLEISSEEFQEDSNHVWVN